MINWNLILDEGALITVLPGRYAKFARPVCEALIHFLNGLPADAQTDILERQSRLSPSATISQRLGELARSCPVLHKLGQILARDQRLAPQLRRHLRALESAPPTVSPSAIARILQRELGPLEKLGIRLAPPAIAEASVAVVMPFVQAQQQCNGHRWQGVFKVLKPGIKERLELELALLGGVGAYLDERCKELGIPNLDYQEAFERIQEKLRHEIHLDREQQHLAQAARFYRYQPRIQIPALLEFCTPRITAMERIHGVKVTDHGLKRQDDRRRLAELVIRGLVARPIFSRLDQAMFHSDPHAGNLLWTNDNRLAILDWSLVGALRQAQRVAIVQLLLAALALDADRIGGILENLGEPERTKRPSLTAIVAASLRRVRQGTLPGMSWLITLLDEAVQSAGLRVQTDLMLFRKSLHTLDGVVAEIGAGVRLNDVLLVDFIDHFASELPTRWLARPDSRNFATHLSNLDLAQAAFNWPAAVERFWIGRTGDLLAACETSGELRN